MANAWIKLVTKTYNNNKTKKGYSFKKAIMDAKKVYKKGGDNTPVETPLETPPVETQLPVETPVQVNVSGGKKTRKNKTAKKRGGKK